MSGKTGIAISAIVCGVGILVSSAIINVYAKSEVNVPHSQPAIKNFPEKNLRAVRDQGQIIAIRSHAWNLLEQLTQYPGEGQRARPLWEGWYTKCTTGQLSRFCGQPQPAIQQTQSNPFPQFSTVYYSPDVANWIMNNHLNDSNYLTKMFGAKTANNQPSSRPTVITPLAPDTSIIVKEIWEATNPNYANQWVIPVYDPNNFAANSTNFLDPYNQWRSLTQSSPAQSHLKSNPDGSLDTTTSCQAGRAPLQANDINQAVPVKCFVFRYAQHCSDITPSFNLMDPEGQNRSLKPDRPCVLVLMGVQIMTREFLENWTWSTFWWTANPVALQGLDRNKSDGRPSDLGPGFQNFAMDTLLSKDGDPALQRNLAPIFNPYLEGPTQDGPQSNCLQCHYKASYVPQTPVGQFQPATGGSSAVGPRNGLVNAATTLISSNSSTLAKDCIGAELQYPVRNHCRLRTGFLWSLSTNQDSQATDKFLQPLRRPFPGDGAKAPSKRVAKP